MKNANLISVSVLIDKYVTVHLNKNDPNKKTHLNIYSVEQQDNFKMKKKKKKKKHLILPYQMGMFVQTYTKKQQIKALRTHNTKMSLETMIVVDSCFIFF